VRAKVLVVDDSSMARRSARGILETAGHEVIEAVDGTSALDRYYVEKPDLVLLDLVMAGMYGLEVLQKLREMDDKAKVIVVTADVQNSTREMVEQAGACGVVTKPIRNEELLSLMNSVLEERP
jgi:two-component system chemotaxis response regulator CheY